jgi:hypothetical protein
MEKKIKPLFYLFWLFLSNFNCVLQVVSMLGNISWITKHVCMSGYLLTDFENLDLRGGGCVCFNE